MQIEFDESTVSPSLPGIVLLSHGGLAAGMLNTVRMIFGDVENVAAVSLMAGDDLDAFRQALTDLFRRLPQGSIALVDMLGGTPCNQFLLHCRACGLAIAAATGFSLPMVLEALSARDEVCGQALIERALAAGGQGAVDLSRFLSR